MQSSVIGMLMRGRPRPTARQQDGSKAAETMKLPELGCQGLTGQHKQQRRQWTALGHAPSHWEGAGQEAIAEHLSRGARVQDPHPTLHTLTKPQLLNTQVNPVTVHPVEGLLEI
jgi:hypothetical protein